MTTNPDPSTERGRTTADHVPDHAKWVRLNGRRNALRIDRIERNGGQIIFHGEFRGCPAAIEVFSYTEARWIA